MKEQFFVISPETWKQIQVQNAPKVLMPLYVHTMWSKLIAFASRNIEQDEEILYDYGDRTKTSLASLSWLSC